MITDFEQIFMMLTLTFDHLPPISKEKIKKIFHYIIPSVALPLVQLHITVGQGVGSVGPALVGFTVL